MSYHKCNRSKDGKNKHELGINGQCIWCDYIKPYLKLPKKIGMGVKFLDKDDKEHRTETEWIKLKINEIIDYMGEK